MPRCGTVSSSIVSNRTSLSHVPFTFEPNRKFIKNCSPSRFDESRKPNVRVFRPHPQLLLPKSSFQIKSINRAVTRYRSTGRTKPRLSLGRADFARRIIRANIQIFSYSPGRKFTMMSEKRIHNSGMEKKKQGGGTSRVI